MKDTIIEGTRLIVKCAEEYMAAVHALSQIKDGKTLWEHSPSKDPEAYEAFIQLNHTGRRLRATLNTVKQGLPSEASDK